MLFKALVDNGMPKENSPVAAMLMKHDQGRGFVRAMEVAVREAQAGRVDACRLIAANALDYAALLRDHIDKEDTILYPLAERVIPETMRTGIQEGYQAAEAHHCFTVGTNTKGPQLIAGLMFFVNPCFRECQASVTRLFGTIYVRCKAGWRVLGHESSCWLTMPSF